MMQSELRQYYVKLTWSRRDWPENMTDNEKQIMEDHYSYLKKLTLQKKVVLAGPCLEARFALIILRAKSEKEAKALIDNDPLVASGLPTYEIYPMHVSLLVDHRSRDRYVAELSDKIIRKEIAVSASLDDVWKSWTTTNGVKTFFSSGAKVELYLGGPYEIYFMQDAPYGLKGSEDCKILSYIPNELLCFEWNAPPSFGELRDIKTQVAVRFEKSKGDMVKLTLAHYGWGKTKKWNELYDYFDSAWSYVLESFKKRLDEKQGD